MRSSSTLRRALFALTLSLALLSSANVSAASALRVDDGASPIVQAEAAYDAGDYTQAITLLEKHLRADDNSPTIQVAAYRLLGLSYLAAGDTAKAQTATDHLIRIFPSYEPAEKDTAEFAALVAESQRRFADGKLARTQKKGGIPQYIYSSLAVVTSAIVLFVGAQSM